MKLGMFEWEGHECWGVLNKEETAIWNVLALSQDKKVTIPATIQGGIEQGFTFTETLKDLVRWGETQGEKYLIQLNKIKMLAPIPRPRKNIFCIGKNYREHAIEMGSEADIPEHLMVFTKPPTTVIPHNGVIPAHEEVTKQLDYEGELAVVIGKKGKGISEQEALEYVFGYTIINDISSRDMQQRHKQFFLGKSLDGSCPMGPWLVLKEAIANPGNLTITTTVNGEIRQNSNTKLCIFPIEEVISVLSKGMTLEPGDIIATGTPAGVGKGFNPPRFLKAGDSIEVEIEGIGKLHNIVK